MVGLVECGVRRFPVAMFEDAEQVTPHIGVDRYRVFATRIRDCRRGFEFIDIKVDKFGGIPGLGKRLGNDTGDGFTDVPNTVTRKGRLFDRASGCR
jgi:hypothetical protein